MPSVTEFDIQVFYNIPTDEKVSFTYDLMKREDVLPDVVSERSKCAQEAIKLRNLGNQYFGQKKDTEALKYYTKSVTLSPKNSDTLALAYANRSAVLLKLNRYRSCLLDIKRALSNNYPDSLKQKLENRKKECLKYLRMQNNLKPESLDISKLSLASNEENWLSIDEKTCTEKKIQELPRVNFNNPSISGASEKIEIRWSREMGRHLVAREDIEPGEILAIENSYASILIPDFHHTHCSYCYHRTVAPIPCEECSTVVFCDIECRQRALEKFHRIECKIVPFLIKMGMDKIVLLAVRTLIVAAKQGENLLNLYHHPHYKNAISEDRPPLTDIYDSTDYLSVHSLENNYWYQSLAILSQRTSNMALALHSLKFTSFFDSANKEVDDLLPYDLTAVERYSGTLLLKYLLTVICNAHEVSELIEMRSSGTNVATESLEIGAALYPLLSLINHSCDPNVVRHNYGDSIVLRSIQKIGKGQQIFDNYGYHFAIHTRDKRQAQLKSQYLFECECDACKYDWPTHDKLFDKIEFTHTPTATLQRQIEESRRVLKDSFSQPLNEACDELYNDLLKLMSMLHDCVKKPCKSYCQCQEVVKQIMAYRANHYTLQDIII